MKPPGGSAPTGTDCAETSLSDVPAVRAAAREVGILGEHESLRTGIERAARAAAYGVPVLLLGETGTGKELFARLIHRLSGRAENPFVPLNCAALPAQLIESELFGHEKGAFSGAAGQHLGAFERASRGTLFLDEIGEMPIDQQAKLLRALQDGKIQRVGGEKLLPVHPRIVAATNVDLVEAISAKRFRHDLYFRFRYVLRLPPLRERRSDIPSLAEAALQRFLAENGLPRGSRRFSAGAIRALQEQLWPGNVRELERVVEMTAIEASHTSIEAAHLQFEARSCAGLSPEPAIPEPYEGFDMKMYLQQVRAKLIARALAKAGSRAGAARLLNCTRQNLANDATLVDA